MNQEAFVERQFESDGEKVVCRFFTPTREPGGEFKCRWSIAWGQQLEARYACGIDGVQALILAMRLVHTQLVESEPYKAGQLTYFEERDLDLPPPFTFGES